MFIQIIALAAATLHSGQTLAGAAFEKFASYTDQACISRQLRAITPGDLSWEQETFEDQLSPYQKRRLTPDNCQKEHCARSEGGLSCPTIQTLDAMRRTGMLSTFGRFACSHPAPIAHLEEHVARPRVITSVGVRGQNAPVATAATEAMAILQHLDLNSFPNSTGPRRRLALRTPDDYGLTKVKTFNDGWAQVSEPDNGWYMSALVLEDSPEFVTLCFLDTGGNGATYRTTQVLHVQLQADARWTALEIADRSDCRNDPPLGASPGVPTFIPHHTMPPRDRRS